MSRYKAYPEYKGSGPEWLANIPTNWKAERLFGNFIEVDERGGEGSDLLAVSQSHGVMPQQDYEKLLDRRLSQQGEGDYSNYKRVKAGDFIYNRMRMWQGAIGVAPCEGIVSPAYVTFRARSECDSRYWISLFKTPTFLVEVNRRSQGICDDQNSCKFERFREIVTPTPDAKVQKQIADSLASETTRIDTLIEKKTRFIELLKEKRQALITHSVTKGLDPDVPMKDSGVEWIGEVPAHWDVERLKWSFILSPSRSETAHLEEDEEVSFIPMEAVTTDGQVKPEIRMAGDGFQGYSYFRKGDVVVAKITPCFENGKGACLSGLPTEYGFGTSEFIVLRTNKRMKPEHLYTIISLRAFRKLGAEEMTGTAGQQRVQSSFVQNFIMAVPPVSEQDEIHSHLNRATTRIDTLIEKIQHSIELLKEKRSTLITAAVTGKIDVRGAAQEAA